MIISIYGDVHLTKNMRAFQNIWDATAMKSIYHMYDKFDEMNVESAICLGDFFDAPRIEAKHMQLVLPILKHINERTYPTYLLLGNHEIDSEESNILDFLSMYDNIIPVTELTEIEGKLFIPYNVDPHTVDNMEGKIVFTHHDIYGSDLAGGKTKAFFGLDPTIFKDAKLVMNGHVHLRSQVAHNIMNAGSILVSQQGELRVGEYPQYYILDTNTMSMTNYENTHSMVYLTSHINDISKIESKGYDTAHLVLKVEYTGDMPTNLIDTLHTSYRKLVESIDSKHQEVIHESNFDMMNYLVEYLTKDPEISEADRESYINTGKELLG